MKKVLLEMEDQRSNYEQKAKESLQKVLEEKMSAERQLQSVQVGMLCRWGCCAGGDAVRVGMLCGWGCCAVGAGTLGTGQSPEQGPGTILLKLNLHFKLCNINKYRTQCVHAL